MKRIKLDKQRHNDLHMSRVIAIFIIFKKYQKSAYEQKNFVIKNWNGYCFDNFGSEKFWSPVPQKHSRSYIIDCNIYVQIQIYI